MTVSIHGPKIYIAKNTATILGTKASVGSCMDVTAWNTETMTPTESPRISGGAAANIMVNIPFWTMLIIVASDMTAYLTGYDLLFVGAH